MPQLDGAPSAPACVDRQTMNLKSSVRTLVSPLIPDGVRKRILQRYYLGKVRTYSRANWDTGESDLQVIRHLVEPGDHVVDVGANFGFYTAYLSERVGHQGSVTSFEPVPRTFDLLAYNVRKLPLTNVRLFNCGVSDSNGSATMGIPQFDSGVENYYQATLVRPGTSGAFSHQVPVELKTLDSVFPAETKLTFVKVDVEGHELHAIAGAQRLIRSSKPALLIEVSGNPDDRGSSAFALWQQLQAEGYAPYWYDGSSLRPRSPGDSSINYFFLTPDQHRHLATRIRCTTSSAV
jgi:FkbM family methyltransferase